MISNPQKWTRNLNNENCFCLCKSDQRKTNFSHSSVLSIREKQEKKPLCGEPTSFLLPNNPILPRPHLIWFVVIFSLASTHLPSVVLHRRDSQGMNVFPSSKWHRFLNLPTTATMTNFPPVGGWFILNFEFAFETCFKINSVLNKSLVRSARLMFRCFLVRSVCLAKVCSGGRAII